MRLPWQKTKSTLTNDQLQSWNDNGFLVLSSFFSATEVQDVNRVIEEKTKQPSTFGKATIDVLHGEFIGRRLKANEAPSEAFDGPIKINDMFLEEPSVRHLALSPSLSQIIAELLDGDPLICNSLNFLWGSQQPDHFDTWYMPPPVANKMVVSSICLEDVSPDAGPLAYYPGSHKLAPYRFSHGGINAVEAEVPACRVYLERELKSAGCERKVFLGKAGDVFLWHAQLLHGGTPITDLQRTRKTLVSHYWRAGDVKWGRAVKVHEHAYYLEREYLS